MQAKASACDQHQALEAQEARRGAGRDANAAGLGSMDWRVRLLPPASMQPHLMHDEHNAFVALVDLPADLSADSVAPKMLSCLQALHSAVRAVMRRTSSTAQD